MPLYEYYCVDCRTRFEALRPMHMADDPISCRQCNSTHTSRALSLFATFSKGEEGNLSSAVTGTGGGCACGGGGCGCGHH